jgi:hypothetical protein
MIESTTLLQFFQPRFGCNGAGCTQAHRRISLADTVFATELILLNAPIVPVEESRKVDATGRRPIVFLGIRSLEVLID